MYSTKSFCNVFAFVSNEPGEVSPIGELTTFAETFTKELATYHHSTLDSYELQNFSSRLDGVAQAMPQRVADQAIALVHRVVQNTLGTSGELYHDEVLLSLKTAAEGLSATDVNMGPMVNHGAWWVPQWISWSDASVGADANGHKLWLSLDAFKTQYTDYEIVVIPPLDDLNVFFNPGSIVESRVKAITPTQMMEAVEAAKGGKPETVVRSDPYEYRDPVNQSRRFDVYWSVLIYGPAGNDPDLIRDALVDYVLANSTHTREEWAALFPDIFKRTEFVFAPFWDSYGSEARIFDHGIYSPIVDYGRAVTWLQQWADGYSAGQITSVAQVMAYPYRSMQMAVVGHPENRDGLMRISQVYGDFLNVGTESTDFARMSLPTQEWATQMMEMITLAESMDASTDMPRGIFRVSRGGITYVGRTIDRILYLVLAKSNTIAPPVPPT